MFAYSIFQQVLTALLPLAWILGTLPPLDALALFILEQCHVFAFGGSPVASTPRLAIQIAGSGLASLVFFVDNNLAILLILANVGYMFSCLDGRYLVGKWIRAFKSKPQSGSGLNECHYSWRDWVFHLVMVISVNASVLLTYLLLKSSSKSPFTLGMELLYTGIALFVAVKLLGDVQRVYVFFGLFRNPFYPKCSLSCGGSNVDVKSVNEKRVAFQIIKFIRLALLRIVSPVLLCAFITADCFLYEANFVTFDYLQIICILRAYRWVTY